MPRRARDRGATFVEVLVSLVLLGTAVGGTLTALRTTIVSGQRDDGDADAQTWLLAVEDALYRTPFVPCTTPTAPDPTGGAATEAAYESAISDPDNAPRPAGWSGATVSIVSLQFWHKDDGLERWDPICPPDDDARNAAQLMTVIVVSPSGDTGKSIELIKRD